MSVPGTHLYQCASWCCCEKLRSTSVNFSWRLFKTSLPISRWWLASTPAYAMLSVQQFLTKNGTTPVPHCISLPNLVLSDFFFVFPWWKKSSKGNVLPMWKRWDKTAEALKGIKTDVFKNYLEQWGKKSQSVYFIKWRVLWKWLKFKHVKINTQCFINKFWVFWGSPLYIISSMGSVRSHCFHKLFKIIKISDFI